MKIKKGVLRFKDMAKIILKNKEIEDEFDENPTLKDAVKEFDCFCGEAKFGLKAFGIIYNYRKKSIKLTKDLDSKIINQTIEDYLTVMEKSGKSEGENLEDFKKILKNEGRAKNAHEYFMKAEGSGDDSIFDYHGTYMITIFSILEDYQKVRNKKK